MSPLTNILPNTHAGVEATKYRLCGACCCIYKPVQYVYLNKYCIYYSLSISLPLYRTTVLSLSKLII